MPTATLVMYGGMLVFVFVALFVWKRFFAAAAAAGYGATGPAEADRLAPPDGKALRIACANSDVSSLNALLGSLPPGAWDDRAFFIGLYAEHINRVILDAWCQNETKSTMAHLLRGRHAIHWAWEARGSGQADTVSAEGWRLYGERLGLAKQDFLYCTQLDPADPTPWAMLVHVGRGLDGADTETPAWFGEAVRRDPEHFLAHENMLSFLTEKWHGSHDKMFRFARDSASRARPGSDLPALIIRAHVERYVYFKLFEDDEAGAERWARDPSNQTEVATVWERALGQVTQKRSSIYFRNHA